MTAGCPFSMTATTELVVPRSIPITLFAICRKHKPLMSVCQACYLSPLQSYLKKSYPTAELRVTSRWRSEGTLCDHAAMRPRIHAVVLPSELGDFGDEVRRVFLELGRTGGSGSLAGEYSPPIDVFETDEAVEVAVDLPG